MLEELTFYGHGLAALSFLTLALFLVTGWKARYRSFQLILAVSGSGIWALGVALHAAFSFPNDDLVQATEIVSNLLWIFFLLHLLTPFAGIHAFYRQMLGFVRLASLVLGLLMLTMLLEAPELAWQERSAGTQDEFSLMGQLLLAVLGMTLVEQLFRNMPVQERWGTKYLFFGLGLFFGFDFYLYTDALLFQRLDDAIWAARGFVNTVVSFVIAITVARNPDWSPPVLLSRRMVLYSTTLFGAGLYMLVMAISSHYIRHYGGAWGSVMQIAFLFGALIVLVTLLFSSQVRARTKVFLNKHFFSYRYDYREEWLRVIGLLARRWVRMPLGERVIWALAEIVDSPGGALWLRNEKGEYWLQAKFNADTAMDDFVRGDEQMVRFMETHHWVINVDEYRSSSNVYGDLILPGWLLNHDALWLVVPLEHDERLIGFVVLLQSRAAQFINWENLDLLKTIGMQSASYLALNQAAEALAEARQLEGFNRLSAFVIHDLKNLIAQLSLVASNASKHKKNPAFVDDAVSTIENSVQKMDRLMTQLKSGDVTGARGRVDLLDELRAVVLAKSNVQPVPVLNSQVRSAFVLAEPDRLSAVLGHVVQNAQDATPPDGHVELVLRVADGQAIVEVRDTGSGMDAEFLKKRLFRPFDSTKGLTGMGIGAYECREVISALGGQVAVHSAVGRGTVFRIMLPLNEQETSSAHESAMAIEKDL